MSITATTISNPSRFPAQISHGAGGYRIEWYRDDDNNSGYGDNAQVAYWFGTYEQCSSRALSDPDPSWWVSCDSKEEGPDRTDPGYWLDNW